MHIRCWWNPGCQLLHLIATSPFIVIGLEWGSSIFRGDTPVAGLMVRPWGPGFQLLCLWWNPRRPVCGGEAQAGRTDTIMS